MEGVCSAIAMAAYTATFIQLYPERVGAITSWSGTVLGIGYSLGPIIGGFFYDIAGFYLPFTLIGILAICLSISTFVALPHKEFQKSEKAVQSSFLTTPTILFKVCTQVDKLRVHSKRKRVSSLCRIQEYFCHTWIVLYAQWELRC